MKNTGAVLDKVGYSDNCIRKAKRYIKDIESGKISAGQAERRAVERHLKDLARVNYKSFPYYFDENKADRVFQFFSYTKHSKGEWSGKQYILADWQCFIIWSLFGWQHKKTHLRKYTQAYIQIARKNGKTTFAAGIALYLLMYDNESGAEIYAAATTKDQARLCHFEAVRMVRQSKDLYEHLEILGGKKPSSIIFDKKFSFFNPLSSDADTLDGLNPSGAIIDELHVHKTPEVWEVLETGTGARKQPLIIGITTAGSNQESICYQQREHGLNILETAVNGGDYVDYSFFAFIAEPDEGDDWTEPKTWRKGNPNLGVSVRVEELAEQCNRARLSPGRQNQFRQKRLNEWVEQSQRFINMEDWAALPKPGKVDLIGRQCFAGLDLSSTRDFTAFVLVFPPVDGLKIWYWLPFFWLPHERVEILKRERRLPIDSWVKAGDLFTTPGNVVDYDLVRDKINDLGELYNILEIGYDPYNAMQIIPKLENDGFELVKMRQGVQTLHAPTRELETQIISKNLCPSTNGVLRYMARNVSVLRDSNGNMKPTRENEKLKIDGIVSGIMGTGRALAHDLTGNSDTMAAITLGGDE